jgi:resuscitation-promoting factor RpfB
MGAAMKLGAAGVVAVIAASAAGSPHGRPDRSVNEVTGRRLAADHHWTGVQWHCLDWLWTRESGWSNVAENSKSGAYGIAQALGHGPTNQYPAGPANPPQSSARAQIDWGLKYIRFTYGTPCGAWSHESSYGWY